MTSPFAQLLAGGILSLILAISARIADRRRQRRRNLDSVGFMPWEAIFVLAALAVVVLFSLALKAWLSD
ncbi:hypothetical protein ACFOD9_10700 [Novosphingobium bradum]|uniref:DUF2970 domain-containing protein n=1 Tax=Novosphingobium bradum TaxID=1737444 RepID=A0ABV7IRX0_9SPHN